MFVPKSNDSIKVYEQKNAIQKDYTLGEYYISKNKFEIMQSFIVEPSDIIVSCAGTIGEVYKLPSVAPKGIINQALMRVKLFNDNLSSFWMMYFDYVLKKEASKQGAGTAIKNIPPFEILKAYPFPLPPLAEQKRIVAAIEKFMPLIEEYGKKETQLKAINEKIGTLTKKAILQEAVQGKLVPQIATEGNAKDFLEEIKKEKEKLIKEGKIKKEKPLPEITEDEIPFDIPESWCYIRPTDIGYFSSGKTPKLNEITNEGYIPYFKVSDMNNKGNELYMTTVIHYLTNNSKYKLFPKNSIIYPKNGGAVFTNKKRILITDSLVDLNTGVFIPIEGIYIKYFYLLFSSIDFKQYYKGTALPTIDLEAVQKIVWALPPLAEQKRIVATIEKMLPLCEKLGE